MGYFMIRSMTGYGRCEELMNGFGVVVEIRSVNHRYFEMKARVPRSCGFLEERLKTFLNGQVSRGKLDVFISVDFSQTETATDVIVNHSLAAGHVNALRELADQYELKNDLSTTALSRYPDIFTVRKPPLDEENLWSAVKTVADGALLKFLQMRENEGKALTDDILSRSGKILKMIAVIEERSPQLVADYRERLEQRLKQILENVQLDEQRLLTETAIMADKTAVAEETVRLRSHIKQLEEILANGGAVGRKLDFLVQEFNREANTIGSKVQDLELTRIVVDIKSEIEKIREQVQNIE